jgi:hypothetical protein
MTKNSLTVTILAAVISVSFALLACGHSDPLNSNDHAQVASGRNPNSTSAPNSNSAGVSPAGTPIPATSGRTAASARPPQRTEIDRDPDRIRRMAAERGSRVGTGPDDAWLWVNTNYRLHTSSRLRASNIQVDVENNVVTLRGTVASTEQAETATAIVREIEGVKNVVNSLTLSPQ